MIKDPQILRAAQVLMDQHGENSMVRAAHVADKLEDQGDIEGSLAWRRIIEVIDDLTRGRTDVSTLQSSGALAAIFTVVLPSNVPTSNAVLGRICLANAQIQINLYRSTDVPIFLLRGRKISTRVTSSLSRKSVKSTRFSFP